MRSRTGTRVHRAALLALLAPLAGLLISNPAAGQDEPPGRALEPVVDARSGVGSLLAEAVAGRELEGSIDQVLVANESETALTIEIRFSGFDGAILRGKVLDRDRRSVHGLRSATATLDAERGSTTLTFSTSEEESAGTILETPFLDLEVIESGRPIAGYLRTFRLDKRWGSDAAPSPPEVAGETVAATEPAIEAPPPEPVLVHPTPVGNTPGSPTASNAAPPPPPTLRQPGARPAPPPSTATAQPSRAARAPAPAPPPTSSSSRAAPAPPPSQAGRHPGAPPASTIATPGLLAVASAFAPKVNLFALADSARWENGSGRALRFPGSTGDAHGYVIAHEKTRLADGKEYTGVLQTHPEFRPSGVIRGEFRVEIPGDAEKLRTGLGFLPNASRSDGALFVVKVKQGNQSRLLLRKLVGSDQVVEVDATIPPELRGKRVLLELEVQAGRSSTQDWAVWVFPRIQ